MINNLIQPCHINQKTSESLLKTSQNNTENVVFLNPRFGTSFEEKQNLDLNFQNRKRNVSEILEDSLSDISIKTSIEKKPKEKTLIKQQLQNQSIYGAFRKLLKATFYRKINDLKPEQRILFGDLADFREMNTKTKQKQPPLRISWKKLS